MPPNCSVNTDAPRRAGGPSFVAPGTLVLLGVREWRFDHWRRNGAVRDFVRAGVWACPGVLAALLCALAAVAGCATTKPTLYLVSADGIGVGAMSPPKSETGIVASNWVDAEGPAIEGTKNIFGGPLGPLGLIVAPFALANDAAQCFQKLEAAYPGLSQKFSDIVQREFSAADVQDQLVAVLQEGTSVPISREEISFGNDETAGERQLLAQAAQHARAHLFMVEISGVSLQPFGKGCDSWKVWAKMRFQLWKVADKKLVLSFSSGYPPPFVTGPLSEMKPVFDEPGALRSRLMPTYEAAARAFSYRAMFQLPP